MMLRMTQLLRVFFAGVAVAIASGCASTGSVEALEIQVVELQAEVEKARRSAKQAQDETAARRTELEQKMATLEQARQSYADSVNQLNLQVTELRTNVTTQVEAAKRLETSLQTELGRIRPQLTNLEQAAARFSQLDAEFGRLSNELSEKVAALDETSQQNERKIVVAFSDLADRNTELTRRIDSETGTLRTSIQNTNIDLNNHRTMVLDRIRETREALQRLGAGLTEVLNTQRQQFQQVQDSYEKALGTIRQNLPETTLANMRPEEIRDVPPRAADPATTAPPAAP